jgi:adenylate kinase family enzyme
MRWRALKTTTLPACLVHDEGMRRVSVVGNAGSGKTVLSQRLAVLLQVPHIELDAIHHLPGWTPIDPDTFRSELDRLTAADGWVIDGNYRTVVMDGAVWDRADTVIWLDLPRRTVMRQMIGRTLLRAFRRQELWNGNRERARNLFSLDPYQSIIAWAWTQHAKYEGRYAAAMASARFSHLGFVRLRTRRDVERWLAGLESASTCARNTRKRLPLR